MSKGVSLGAQRTASADDKFTPTKQLTPPPHHSSRPAAAHTDTETPVLQKKKGRARRRTAPTDMAHNWATQARPRRSGCRRRRRILYVLCPVQSCARSLCMWGVSVCGGAVVVESTVNSEPCYLLLLRFSYLDSIRQRLIDERKL